ncbi:MAG: sulfate ABC transporter permease subunit CysW [Lentisphaeria bacterium]
MSTNKKITDFPLKINIILSLAAISIVTIFVVLPLWVIVSEGFSQGLQIWWHNVSDPDTIAAIRLTLLVTFIVVPSNVIFGIVAAWALAKFRFKGRNLILSLIDLPFAVSPIISGLIFVLMFGIQGWFGPFLQNHNIQIIFAVPGVIIATLFVTFPFVARELIPLMTEQGSEEEEAALILGATPWQMFFRVTLPNIKWGLLYGIILCNARAMGEFGAVSVVSGHIRGATNTLPLHVEILYNEYNFAAAFASATLLTSLGILTIIIKQIIELRHKRNGESL